MIDAPGTTAEETCILLRVNVFRNVRAKSEIWHGDRRVKSRRSIIRGGDDFTNNTLHCTNHTLYYLLLSSLTTRLTMQYDDE